VPDLRVLVVDDEPPIVALYLEALRRAGFEVESAHDAQSALIKLAAGPVDLLVVDYRLPDLTGLEVVQCARAMRSGIKTVLITGHLTRKADAEAKSNGINAILSKPFTLDELSRTIHAALASGGGPS
jgi:DNA-binding response OmpR family regulator